MDLVLLGKVVNTHGIKGEVRILSDFEYKDQAFKIGNKLYIDEELLAIKSYRRHKNYDMVSFEGMFSINDVLKYKGSDVYIDREQLDIKNPLLCDLIGMDVYDSDNIYRGKVINIIKSKQYNLLLVKHNKEFMIPYIDEFIKDVNDKIIINYIKGLEDEN